MFLLFLYDLGIAGFRHADSLPLSFWAECRSVQGIHVISCMRVMSQNSKIVCSWLNKTTRNHKGNSAPISYQDRDNTSLLARVYSSCCAPCTAKEPSIHYEKTQLRLVAEERPGGDDKVLFLILCLPFACERYLLETFEGFS